MLLPGNYSWTQNPFLRDSPSTFTWTRSSAYGVNVWRTAVIRYPWCRSRRLADDREEEHSRKPRAVQKCRDRCRMFDGAIVCFIQKIGVVSQRPKRLATVKCFAANAREWASLIVDIGIAWISLLTEHREQRRDPHGLANSDWPYKCYLPM